jgi:sec-independent protein translocase protein TatC
MSHRDKPESEDEQKDPSSGGSEEFRYERAPSDQTVPTDRKLQRRNPDDSAAGADSSASEEKLPAAQGSDAGGPPQPSGAGGDSGGGGGDDDGFEDPEEAALGGRMTFLEHLDELRRRILYSIIAVVVTFVASWIFREAIFGFLAAPIKNLGLELHATRPTDAFTIYLKVSFVAGLFLAIPVVLYQVWAFIAPGLYKNEKSYVLPFLFSSTVLFVLGGVFAYYVILPPALNFLLIEFGREFTSIIRAIDFFDFVLVIIVGMGVIFQLPVLVAFLSIFGLITPSFLWRNFRYAFLLIVIIAAVVSPTTDPFNLFLWSGPMVVLYMISIGISWIFKRRRAKAE